MTSKNPFDKYKGMTKEEMAVAARKPASVKGLADKVGTDMGTPSVAIRPIQRKK